MAHFDEFRKIGILRNQAFRSVPQNSRHPMQLGVISLEFYPRPEWCPFGLVEWSGPSECNWCPPCLHLEAFATSLPTPYPTLPHLPPCNAGLKLMHTCEKIV